MPRVNETRVIALQAEQPWVAIPDILKTFKAQVDSNQPATSTVRELLSWYQARRRGRHIVNEIRADLKELELSTIPDFDSVWIDDHVSFTKASLELTENSKAVQPTLSESSGLSEENTSQSQAVHITRLDIQDPSYSVRKLEQANRQPVRVNPDTLISEAVILMMTRDYSQLPVMSGERSVRGLFSWKSLASSLVLHQRPEKVSEAMDSVLIVSGEASIFQVAELLSSEEVVLVRKSVTDPLITGMVTGSDLARHLGDVGEPFLLLGEIETRLRVSIDAVFSAEQLRQSLDPERSGRTDVQSASDLSFGEYVRLLQDPDNWSRWPLKSLDRATFTKSLDRVREARNNVMHFDPESLDEEAIETLRGFARFLKRTDDMLRTHLPVKAMPLS